MPEFPPDHSPVLSYASPRPRAKLRVPGYLEAILRLWAVFTVVYGVLWFRRQV